VDTEVKRILDDAHERAREILEKEDDLLERIAQALLERETLARTEIDLLDQGKELPPMEKILLPGEEPDDSPLLNPPEETPDPEPVPAAATPAPDEADAERPSPLAHALDRKGALDGEPVEDTAGVSADQEELQLGEGDTDRIPS
jgi:cell division protease FtsH